MTRLHTPSSLFTRPPNVSRNPQLRFALPANADPTHSTTSPQAIKKGRRKMYKMHKPHSPDAAPVHSTLVPSTRKRCVYLAAMLVLLLSLAVPVFAAEQTTVVPNIIEDGLVYLPLRDTFEELGYRVSWIADDRKAVVEDDDSSTEYKLSETEHVLLLDNVLFVSRDHCAVKEQLGYIAQTKEQTLVYRIDEPDPERMMQAFEKVAAEPRPPLSEEAATVREFLISSLQTLGYETELQAITGAAAYLPPSSHLYEEKPGTAGYNLIATKPSRSNDIAPALLILGTGYDSNPDSPEAIAGGSGVVGLLEVAELVKDIPSPVELRFVFFDCTSSDLGPFHYARSLSKDEIGRTIGMIELDLVGSRAESATRAHTLDGTPNVLSDSLVSFDLASVPQGAFTSFYSLNIPTVLISEDPDATMNYITFMNDKKDTLDLVDEAKLSHTVDRLADAVGLLLSDASAAWRGSEDAEIDARQIGSLLPLTQRFAFDEMSKEDIEKRIEVPLVRVPIAPVWNKLAYASYAAYIDWLGLPLLTHFQFTSQRSELSDIRATVPDADELIVLLDAQFTRFDEAEPYLFAQVTNSLEDALCWHDDNGNAYVLEQGASEATLWLSAYRKDAAPLSIRALTDANEEAPLSKTELRAWQMVEELLLAANLRDDVQDVVFTDDGKGGATASIALAPLAADIATPQYTLTIDANDLAAADREQLDAAALQSFLRSWALVLPDAYLTAYVDAFGSQWVTAYIEQERGKVSPLPSEKARELEAQTLAEPMRMAAFMKQDLADAFIYYTCGIAPDDAASASVLEQSFAKLYGDDYDAALEAFFSDFTDLSDLKAYIATIS